ncbi:MAG: FHA domain-containing protein [Planctomycetaceae bacterium]|nr:FHA domain-containing protein [Planctomycetaceae bacterium]
MARVTLSVLEGLERGRVYRNLETPISIGREEDNSIQLNDERVSRLHAKLQEDQGLVLFTDLHSTNGSRVNGHPVQLRVLRAGDHIQIGRCTLLYGSDEEIEDRAKRLGVDVRALLPWQGPPNGSVPAGGLPDAEFSLSDNLTIDNMMAPLFFGEGPPLPDALSTSQRARLSDVLTYIHEHLNCIVQTGREADEPSQGQMHVPWERWQNLLLLQRDLAQWLQQVANPED